MSTDEFWTDDAESIARLERERASGLRMPAPSSARSLPTPESAATFKSEYRSVASADKPAKAGWEGWFKLIGLCVCASIVVITMTGLNRKNRTQETAAFSATDEEKQKLGQLVGDLKKSQVILKIEMKRHFAVVYVLPPFHQLNVDEKSFAIRICYLAAWQLPPTTERSTKLMDIRDAITGKSLRTVDMDIHGLGWR